jgi:hypothetical protein
MKLFHKNSNYGTAHVMLDICSYVMRRCPFLSPDPPSIRAEWLPNCIAFL